MRYKDQINVKLYSYINGAFVLQAIIDDYQEISFSHNLYEAGDFTITINYNIPNALKFERGMFIQFGNDAYMFGEILRINDAIGEDGKGSQIRTITGKDSRYIFKRRIIKNLNNEENWAMTAKGEICLRELIKAQCGSGAEAKRQLPITNTIPSSSNAIGKEYSVAESFSNLYDTLVTIATQSEIGWRIKFDGSLTLECFEGSDLSSQVQFSTDFDSLANGEFTDSAESFANTIYVGGKGTGSDRDIYEGESAISGNSPSGFDRFEAWDNQSSMTVESEYEAEALSMLSQYGQTINVSGQGLAVCPYVFKEQYDIGDTITLAFSGKSAKAQILSVTEHWVWGEYGIEFSFGKPQNDLTRQLQLILKQIQKASNKTTTTSSVKYYTIPTDTQMPKADVIYDTIGFVGDVGNGATFQLYLDDEKTGAKTYHVWFKQLAGSGKLTLTTGKAGASNLVMNSGTYVAIIYVDAQGNITMAGATTTDTISANNNLPASSQGVANAISNKANTLYIPSPAGATKYAMIKSNVVSFNGILCNRYNGMILFAGYGGTTYPNLLYPSSDYGIKGIKVFSALESGSRRTYVLIKYTNYAPMNFLQLDVLADYTVDPDISQALYDDPESNFSSVQDLAVYNALSLIPRISFPIAPITSGTYNLRCTVSGGNPSYSWGEIFKYSKFTASTFRPSDFAIVCTGTVKINFVKYSDTGEVLEYVNGFIDGSANLAMVQEKSANANLYYDSANSRFVISCSMVAGETKLTVATILSGNITTFAFY